MAAKATDHIDELIKECEAIGDVVDEIDLTSVKRDAILTLKMAANKLRVLRKLSAK